MVILFAISFQIQASEACDEMPEDNVICPVCLGVLSLFYSDMIEWHFIWLQNFSINADVFPEWTLFEKIKFLKWGVCVFNCCGDNCVRPTYFQSRNNKCKWLS